MSGELDNPTERRIKVELAFRRAKYNRGYRRAREDMEMNEVELDPKLRKIAFHSQSSIPYQWWVIGR